MKPRNVGWLHLAALFTLFLSIELEPSLWNSIALHLHPDTGLRSLASVSFETQRRCYEDKVQTYGIRTGWVCLQIRSCCAHTNEFSSGGPLAQEKLVDLLKSYNWCSAS